MVPLGAPRKNADYNSTPHLFEWMSIKFFDPADGVIGNVEDKQEHGELEQQFTIQSTEYPGYYFGFYHVKLDPSLGNGSEVKAGQQIGTLGNEESYAEISVEARINSREIHLMSFLEVATDEVFDEYRARGVNSLSDVITTFKSTSALEAKLTSAICSPVAGLNTLDVLLEDPLVILPSIKCSIKFISV